MIYREYNLEPFNNLVGYSRITLDFLHKKNSYEFRSSTSFIWRCGPIIYQEISYKQQMYQETNKTNSMQKNWKKVCLAPLGTRTT